MADPASLPECPRHVPRDAVYEPDQRHWHCRQTIDAESGLESLKTYREDGSLLLEQAFVAGRPEGLLRRYHPNGELALQGRYVNGVPSGDFVAFASTGETSEVLRACCVPEGAWSMHSRYDNGQLHSEYFCDRKGRRLLSDGSLHPDRPSIVPAAAHFDEGDKCWVLGTYDERLRRQGAWRWWFVDGVLKKTADYQDDAFDGVVEEFDERGQLQSRVSYRAGARFGASERRDQAGLYADSRIVSSRGFYELDVPVGEWQFTNHEGTPLFKTDWGVYRSDAELLQSEVLSGEYRSQEQWQSLCKTLLAERRLGEALLAAARAGAQARDPAMFEQLLVLYVPPRTEAETQKALEALRKTDQTASISDAVTALLSGIHPADVLHRLAVRVSGRPRSALQFVEAAVLISGPRPEFLLTRALVWLDVGNVAAALEDSRVLAESSIESASFIEQYARILFFSFDFWPHQVALLDTEFEELPDEVDQLPEQVWAALQKCATRLTELRRAVLRALFSFADLTPDATPAWLPPEVSHLLPAGPAPLVRFDFEIIENDTPVTVRVDETLDLGETSIPLLMRRVRVEWTALCWLCWAVGSDGPTLPAQIASRREFNRALGTSVQRYWRAQDRLTTYGLKARMHQVAGFVWENMDIDEMPQAFARLAADEYREMRAVLFYLADAECRSMWQDDLRPV